MLLPPSTLAILVLAALAAGCATPEPYHAEHADTLEPTQTWAAQFEVLADARYTFDVQATGGRVGVYVIPEEERRDFMRGDQFSHLSPGGYPNVTQIRQTISLAPGHYALGVRCESEAACAFRAVLDLEATS